MQIDLYIGQEAERLLEDAEFRQQWRNLYARCPWASVYQGEEFVATWYEIYRAPYRALLLTSVDENGSLVGMFPLAVNADTGQIVAAGDKQAEYQAWLSLPEQENQFIESALERLCKDFPGKSLTLLFVLPKVPVAWAYTGKRWSRQCHARSMPRGLMEVGDGTSFKDTLRKKKQSKVNRLKRLGNLHLDRITEPGELGAIFDDFLSFQGLRLRAIHNLPDVPHDPLMKNFYMKLITIPRMVHATALRVDDKLVSAQIHLYNNEQVILNLITHSPFYSRYSPGELHILMTGMELAKEEIPFFDLTPGGNYKERYATYHDEVHVITVFFSESACRKYKATRKLAESTKSLFQKIGVTPERARDFYLTILDSKKKWTSLSKPALIVAGLKRLKGLFWHTEQVQMFSCPTDSPANSASSSLTCDQVADLLRYRPREVWQPPVNQFMKRVLENLEAGYHFFTRIEHGELVQYGWRMEPQPGKPFLVNGFEIPLPPDASLLFDFYSTGDRASQPVTSIAQMVGDVMRTPAKGPALFCLAAGNQSFRHALENAGFRYEYSLFRKKAFGKSTQWSDRADINALLNETQAANLSEKEAASES